MNLEESLLPNAVGSPVDDGINITWRKEESVGCYSCFSLESEQTSHISFHNVLYCSVVSGSDDIFEISHVSSSHNVENIILQMNGAGYQDPNLFAQHIVDRAYPGSNNRPNILFLINLKGGKGEAGTIYRDQIQPILEASRLKYKALYTERAKHAMEIASELDIDQYDIIACCSGDGIPHEVINGLNLRPDRARAFNKLAIAQLPCGSGNAFSLSVFGTTDCGLATLEMLKLKKIQIDIMSVTQGDRTNLSFLSQAFGAIADCDIGTESLKCMGLIRFELGLTYRVLTKAKYPCDLYVKYAIENKKEIQEHFRLYNRDTDLQKEKRRILSKDLELKYPDLDSPVPSDWQLIPREETENLSIFYVGNMPYVLTDAQFFPAAISDDGYMDMVIFHNKISRWHYTNLLLNVHNGGHVHHDDVRHAKITAYRLVPRVQDPQKHFISVDGESFPVVPMQVEVLPGILTVLLKDDCYVDTKFGHN